MSTLNADHFEAFFEEVHRYPPFPWQSRLARNVLEEGRFPALLDLPTGSGKTAAIDVAVFALAADLEGGLGHRRLPCRIAFVVDRRTVVDQSFQRAQALAEALEAARPGTVVHRVAERLGELAGSDAPLHVALLRGAVPRDDTWAANPAQPTVLVSTVDQVGSRLLFRGYGVSDGMRPVHAGLLGNDLLLLLDEVHLARPFCDTLRMLARYHTNRIGPALPRRFQVAELSATHRGGGAEPFRLGPADRENKRLARRLTARKPARLETVKVSGEEPARLAALARKVATAAGDEARPGRAVGVVVNRVHAARLVHRHLAERGLNADLYLLTGRMRPLDRQALERTLELRFGTERKRDPATRAAVLVATQCIEAGADFDFDALITECASLDALRQRFGRLNRAGATDDATGAVFARSDIDKGDPIYGEAAAKTWAHLNDCPTIDFGPEALPLPAASDLELLLAPATTSPILLPAYLDAWSQTSPAPSPDPDVALWLHGPQEPAPEVLVVWRGDLDAAELKAAERETAPEGELGPLGGALAERLDACPPLTSEGLTLPIWSVRAWLAGNVEAGDAELADVEHGRQVAQPEGQSDRPVLVRRGGRTRIQRPDNIKPWDTVVVPAEYGGLHEHNWDPMAESAVSDLAEAAHLRQRGRAVLRLDERLWSGNAPPTPLDEEPMAEARERIRDFLAQQSEAPVHDEKNVEQAAVIHQILGDFRKGGPRLVRVQGKDCADRWVVVARHTTRDARRAPGLTSPDLVPEGDDLSFIGENIPLDEHLRGVGNFAEHFARRCGLPERVTRDLRLAGELHDLGKHDRRFQQLLHGGSEYRALTAPAPLAKSPISNRDRRLREEARRRADYPIGTRHELVSLALLQNAAALREAAGDWELVQHLVASHHGYCRPFAPVEPEPREGPIAVEAEANGSRLTASSDHGLAALDSGVSDRFFSLVERYGCHGLAWLEAILRLADHRRSELEEEGSE